MEWQSDKPPDGALVEVEWECRTIRVRAIWGRDGRLPHWESEDKDTLWHPSAFNRWRQLASEERPQRSCCAS